MIGVREQSGDMDRIQQDAMRRMQEMQARAKNQPPRAGQQNTQQGNMGHSPHNPQAPQRSAQHGVAPPLQRETPPVKTPEEKKPVVAAHTHNDLLGSLFEDKERSLILILILILSSEKADSSLILALMYLII